MANAVDSCKCLLMCVTEKYRQSINCQAEAKYAHKRNKKIIPVIMQNGYHNVKGWLGFIISDKIFVDFTKYQFDDALSRLVNQINHLTFPKEKNESIENMIALEQPPANQESQIDSSKIIESWSAESTEKWFNNKDLSNLHTILKPIDGKVLEQLKMMQKHTPEFFFQSMAQMGSKNIKEIAVFSALLKEL